jgi:hypothetical protein
MTVGDATVVVAVVVVVGFVLVVAPFAFCVPILHEAFSLVGLALFGTTSATLFNALKITFFNALRLSS